MCLSHAFVAFKFNFAKITTSVKTKLTRSTTHNNKVNKLFKHSHIPNINQGHNHVWGNKPQLIATSLTKKLFPSFPWPSMWLHRHSHFNDVIE